MDLSVRRRNIAQAGLIFVCLFKSFIKVVGSKHLNTIVDVAQFWGVKVMRIVNLILIPPRERFISIGMISLSAVNSCGF